MVTIRNSNLTVHNRLIRSTFYGYHARRNTELVQITSFVPCYMGTKTKEFIWGLIKKKWNKNSTKRLLKDDFPTKIWKTFVTLCNFSSFIPIVRYELQKIFLKVLVTNKTYVLWKMSKMTETDVADSYEISWYVYISWLRFGVENKTDIKSSYNI